MAALTAPGFEVGSATRPADGYGVGGDIAFTLILEQFVILTIVDVLGHGPEAYVVASRVDDALQTCRATSEEQVLNELERHLAGTCGAAIGVAVLDGRTGWGGYIGIGNTVARLFGHDERRLVSTDGVAGLGHVKPRRTEFFMGPRDVLVMHSDGISSRFRLDGYPQLLGEDVCTSARELIRRFGRDYDDCACIVVRRTA